MLLSLRFKTFEFQRFILNKYVFITVCHSAWCHELMLSYLTCWHALLHTYFHASTLVATMRPTVETVDSRLVAASHAIGGPR